MIEAQQKPFRAGLIAGLLHGLLYGLAFPPFNLWFLALIAPVPLILLTRPPIRPARAALGAGLGTVCMWAFHHQYTWQTTEAAFVPLAFYLALYPGLFVWMLARVRRRWPRWPVVLAAPGLWTGLELLRGEVVWDGYAQYLLGHPLIETWIAGIARWVGVYGVGTLVVLTAALVAALFGTRRTRMLRAAAPAAAALILACIPFPKPREVPTGALITIAAVQTNVPQDNRLSQSIADRLGNFRNFCDLTREAARQTPKPDLIIWPEAMFPGYALNHDAVEIERDARLVYPGNIRSTDFYDALIELQQEINIPMLIGAQAVEGLRISATTDNRIDIAQDAIYNSVFMLRAGAVEPRRYDKMQLMPFGEVMPYISRWDWLEKQLLALGGRGLTFDLEPGTHTTEFEIIPAGATPAAPVRISAPICFESVFARQMRRLIDPGGSRQADLFVNMSNDGWFAWYDAGRANIVLQSRWRSLELATPMLRAANTGISAAIDADGRLLSALAPRTPGVLNWTFDVRPRQLTIYAASGDVLGWTCLALTILVTAGTFLPSGSFSKKVKP